MAKAQQVEAIDRLYRAMGLAYDKRRGMLKTKDELAIMHRRALRAKRLRCYGDKLDIYPAITAMRRWYLWYVSEAILRDLDDPRGYAWYWLEKRPEFKGVTYELKLWLDNG